MWFLIKGSFWFGLVLVALSVFSSESSDNAGHTQLQFSDAFTAVSGAYDYMTGMCAERPEVCTKGGETLTALGYRAREGARVAYELLDSQFKDDTSKSAPAKSAIPPAPVALAAPSLPDAVTTTVREAQAALNQPMPHMPQPYRPPVDDGASAEQVVTSTIPAATIPAGAIPRPTPKPAI
ncbi:DUF5330 domain-containing protein [Rhizobium sp. BK650]|uniref:DUF5330 domain-containing protein n=1 Tax=Rhizobium sp. BK650 TaxID=2586990 RepID=UPI00161EB5EF|nr:DUF5330 domain-containing protein [Rhizobium sp. BK650]